MARIRTIKPEFWTDDKIVNLPYAARLFFIGLWNFADDYGCLPDKPDQLKLLVLPSDDTFDVYQMLDLLIAFDLVELFMDEENDSTFLVIKNWSIHQKVDKPAKSRILNSNAKKVSIPLWVRRKVAEKYGCIPGKSKGCECYFCGTKGTIYWPTKRNGEPSAWVSFSLELAHFVAESNGGATDNTNIVLACRNCNRSMGVKNAFDWLFSAEYSGNHASPTINRFREASRTFESVRDGKEGKGKERNGMEEGGGEPPPEVFRKKLELVFPFSEKFMEQWILWKEYKKAQFKFLYKSIQSEQASLNDLVNLSGGSEEKALAIIHQSMAKGWKGFFELKTDGNNEKGSHQNGAAGTGSKKATGAGLQSALAKFYHQE